MSTFAIESGSPKIMTASGSVTPCSGALIGFEVNSTSSGTMQLLDGGAFGTALSGTITPAVGFHRFPATFNNGLYVGIGGTINVTFFFIGQSLGGGSTAEPTPSFYLPMEDAGNGRVNATPNIGVGSETFTRATTATTIGSTGLIIPVSSGVPRSYYDPTTLVYQGYLAEGARTNLCLQSNGFDTTWANTVGTPTQVQDAVGPDGSETSAWTVTDNDAATIERKSQDISVADNTTVYCYSMFYAKTVGAASFPGLVMGFSGGTALTYDYLVNTNTGTMTARLGNASGATVVVKEYQNFWRATITAANNGLGNTILRVGYCPAVAATDTATWSAAVTGTAIIFGAQLEAGTFPSSYIPTTTAAVTRNADVLTYPFAGNADATVGTAYAELGTEWSATTGAAQMAIGFDASANGPLRVVSNAPTVINITDGTTTTVTKTGLTNMATGSRKRSSSWGGSTMGCTGDGAAIQSGAFDGNLGNTAIGVGCDTAGGRQWFGTIKNVRIWTTQFSAAQLQDITD